MAPTKVGPYCAGTRYSFAMAGQSLERREVLRVLALAAAASSFPGFSRWSFGCGHGTDIVQIRPSQYTPRFFTQTNTPPSNASRR